MKMTAIRSSNFRRMLASALMATSAIMGMNLSGCVTYLDSRIAGRTDFTQLDVRGLERQIFLLLPLWKLTDRSTQFYNAML